MSNLPVLNFSLSQIFDFPNGNVMIYFFLSVEISSTFGEKLITIFKKTFLYYKLMLPYLLGVVLF